MNTKRKIRGEVAVEVGTDMTVTGIIGVRERVTTVAGAAVQVLTTTETVGEPDMMMTGAVGAGPMGVPPLFGVALNLEGAHLLVGHLQGEKTLRYVILTNALLLQMMLHRVADELVLEVLLLVDLMLRNDGAAYNVIGVLHWLEASCLHSRSGSSS